MQGCFGGQSLNDNIPGRAGSVAHGSGTGLRAGIQLRGGTGQRQGQ